MTVWGMFESAAARFADRTAVEVQRADRLESWSYGELLGAALERARRLAGAGIQPGDRCAILADNDAEWCATYFGILRAGGVAMPLDTSYSLAQAAAIIRDASPRVLLVNARLSSLAHEAVRNAPFTRVVDIQAPAGLGDSAALSADRRTGGDAAVIMYTAGATAAPKGVMLTNGNLIAARDAMSQVIVLSDTDRVLGMLPLSHSLGQLANVLLPCSVGARIVFLESLGESNIVRALSQRGITVVACLPHALYSIHQRLREAESGGILRTGLFRALAALNARRRPGGPNLGPVFFRRVHRVLGRRLRFFLTGGTKFDPRVRRELHALGFSVLEVYGLTETCGVATLTTADEANRATGGRPLPGQEIKVDGEVAIRGPIVMQGYYNRPELTADVMRDGWFLTGDLGRLDEAGGLTITGRTRDVILLASGERIDPEEVEAVYSQSAFISEVCVLPAVTRDQPASERLFAVVVPNLDLIRRRRITNAGDLLRFEMEGQSIHLPAHKRVVDYDIWFEALPRTATGTIRRHVIAQRLADSREQKRLRDNQPSPAHPWWSNDAHAAATVAVIAARQAGRPVHATSNLELDLGFDSLGRVELLAELERQCGVRISSELAHEIFTVQQLIEATRSGAVFGASVAAEDSWGPMLRDLPPANDPVLRGLLAARPIAAPLLFLMPRILRMVLPRVDVRGLSHLPLNGPYIISPNHQGFLDPFIVCGCLAFPLFRQLFFVGATEYFETKATAWLARKGNCVPIDPDANLVRAMKAGAFGLAHGKILLLFPEGERSIDGTVKRFKKGASILAKHLRVPIVPVAIRGSHEIWARNRPVNWRLLGPWSGHRIRVVFGGPLRVDQSTDYTNAAAQLEATVRTMWEELQ